VVSTPVRAAKPAVTDITPTTGSTVGGTRVTITGRNLRGATAVTFGGVPGIDLRRLSATRVSVTAPPRAEDGNVNIRVTTAAGNSPGASPVKFRYVTPPGVAELEPASGSTGGNTVVTIIGTSFTGTSAVTFGGVPATVLTVAPDEIRVAAPPHEATGPVDVQVTTLGGISPVTATYSYTAAPAVTAVSPNSGTTDGGSKITITGANLTGATEVTFGGALATALTVVSPTQIVATTPARTATGDVDVRVTTPAGVSDGATTASFSYAAAPVVASEHARDLVPLGLIGLLSWSVWFIRRYLSRHRYQPVCNNFTTTTSVVVPVYREDVDVLERCLRTWWREKPTEIILVVDDRDWLLLGRLAELNFPGVRVLEWRHTGKRGALGAGVREAIGEIVIFADSDTEWRPGLLANIVMPFVDRRVGGVGSRQHVYLPTSNVWRRVAYWMLNSRYLDYVPAMSRRGGVACLSGRTAAYRNEVIRPLLPALEHEMFLGKQCVAGDDGRLTWLVLAAGFKTVHQDTAQADSMFPAELRAFVRQRVRWSRNSYRCYLTALSHGWLWRQPFITQVTVLQILLTPISMGATLWYGARWVDRGGAIALVIVLAWAILGRALRATSHLLENPRDVVLAPLMAAVVSFIALPIKALAMFTMNRHGWLTRQDTGRVQGQGEIEVVTSASHS
jgi:hyaluronan synthase